MDFADRIKSIVIGLIVMMWPILTKVKYEALSRISIFSWSAVVHGNQHDPELGHRPPCHAWFRMNHVSRPPNVQDRRDRVILVGLARCIAMVMVWKQLAGGISPYAVLFLKSFHLAYGAVAISVLIYFGIPLLAGTIKCFAVMRLKFFEQTSVPRSSPLALVGLLYTIIVVFAYQGHHIVQNLAFALVFCLARREFRQGNAENRNFEKEMAVAQAFTAGSNNFELAVAVAIAVYGVGSDQALAATIGPLAEVPVLLALIWVAQYWPVRPR
ncbi:hypothetical protein DFH29DRAFT_985727 [Suillus ampliporus]|nr:hypothetical protein DFH29DRAFT_985727 [Suillus ampliporus]